MKDEARSEQLNNDNLADGKYSIQDLVDLEKLRNIFEKFTQSTGFTIGFLDHPGLNVLIATGWRDICTKFHRACPASIENCMKSNKHLLEQLKEPGQIIIEECENSLVDCATPIIIKGEHIASLATGQLLLKPPDIERFKKQAHMFGYNEQEYLEALKDIPVVSEKKLKSITSFLGEIATLISEMGYSNLAIKEEAGLLDKEITERKKAEKALVESEQKYRTLVDNALVGTYKTNLKGDVLYVNDALVKVLEFKSREEMMAEGVLMRYKNPKDRNILIERLKKRGQVESFETELLTKTKKVKDVFLSASLDGDFISGMIIDITERKRAEEEVKKRVKELEDFYRMAVGREVRMIELKEEIEKLKEELVKYKK